MGSRGEAIAAPLARWRLLVLDSSGLSAVARSEVRALAVLDLSRRAEARVVVPAIVIAESTQGNPKDAAMNRVINTLEVVPVDEAGAREAAALKSAAQMAGVEHTIDALVVAVASVAGGGAILTSDLDDITALASARPDLTIVPIRA